jgi:serine/arginine repetitive matrix protein 1
MASAGDARLMKSTKFPAEFSQKVDMQKVNLQVIKKFVTGSPYLSALSWSSDFSSADRKPHRWIANRISEILGNEDDVVIEMCFNLIEGPRHVSLLFIALVVDNLNYNSAMLTIVVASPT